MGGQEHSKRPDTWIGAARIALWDTHGDALALGRRRRGRAQAGLRVIDTRDWSIRTLDERAFSFVAAAGLLPTSAREGRGLTAYTPDGDERFHVPDSRHVKIVASAGSLAYVHTPPDPACRWSISRGRVIGTNAPGRATLLFEHAAAGWQ